MNNRLANPLDRLAAAIVDIIVLAVLSSLLLAPFRKALLLSRLTDSTENLVFNLACYFIIVLLMALIPMTLFIWKWGQTPGKKIFKIKIINIWGTPITLSQAFLRVTFWWVSWCSLAIPFFSVFADKNRRPIHDRIADTMVVSQGNRFCQVPHRSEVFLTQLIFVSIFIIVGALVVFNASQIVQSSAWTEYFDDMESGRTCQTVDDAIEGWSEETRLALALALFTTEDIDKECLEKEAQYFIQTNEELPLAYLARAFVTSEKPELSDRYLEQVCLEDSESEACAFSEIISDWTAKNWDFANKKLEKVLPQASVFVKLWAVKHFERTKEFAKELSLIRSIWPQPLFQSFLAARRIVSYWGMAQPEQAEAAFEMVAENLDSSTSLQVSHWLCNQQLEHGCNWENSACNFLRLLAEEDSDVLLKKPIAMTYVKEHLCSKAVKPSEMLEKILDFSDDHSITDFYAVAEMINSNDLKGAFKKMTKCLDSSNCEDALVYEFNLVTIQHAPHAKKLKLAIEYWNKLDDQTWNWKNMGEQLFARLFYLGDFKEAYQIGSKLRIDHDFDSEMKKQFVRAAYHAQLYKQAWELLPARSKARLPASENDYVVIHSELEKRFGVK